MTNSGDTAAEDVIVTDTIPQYTTYVANSASDGGVHNSDTGTITWEIGTLEPGKTVKVSFQVKVQGIANNTEREIRNVAQYRHDGEKPEDTNEVEHRQKRRDGGSDGGGKDKDPGTDKPDEHDRTPGTDGGGNGGRERSKDFGSGVDIHDEDIPLATTLLDGETPLSTLDIPDTGLWKYFWMIQFLPSLCLAVVGVSLIAGSRRKEE